MREILSSSRTLDRIVVNEVLADFITYIDASFTTVKTYHKSLRQMFSYLSSRGISKPTRENLLEFRQYLEDTNHKPTTITLYLAAARRFFTWCESKGIYPNIAGGIKAPRISKGHKKDYLSASQIKQIMSNINRDSLEGKRNYAIIALMSTTGLRTIEITRANIEDMRNIGGVTVLYVQGKGKTDKADFVKLEQPVIKAIQEYLKERGQVKENEPLFASCSRRNKGGRLTTRTISSICKQSMIKTGFNSSRLTAHSLRHSAITIALMSGINLADVQAYARHTSINTTMIYAHNVNRLKSLCEQSISNAIFYA